MVGANCYSECRGRRARLTPSQEPPCGPGNEDKPTSGTLAGTAFRLSGIRARDNAAESDEAMASNDDKKKARELLAANPGMKYTEALRTVQRPRSGAAPLALGTRQSDPSKRVHVLNSLTSNLAVLGSSQSGHTAVLRHLAQAALGKGWRVSIVYSQHDGYRDLRVDAPAQTQWPASEDEGRDFLATLTPGTASRPHLVVIDDGDRLFVPERGREGLLDEGWVTVMERLLAARHTAVAVQSQTFQRSHYPHRIMQHFGERLVLGRPSMHALASFLGDVVPAAGALGSLRLAAEDSLFWDGEHLTPVAPGRSQTDLMDAQGKATRWVPLTSSLQDLPPGERTFLRDVDLPPGSLDPFALASDATALTHAGLAEVFPGSRLGKVESTQTAEGAFLYRSDELDPLNLRVGGNMLLVAPPGTGGEGLVRGLVAANAGAGSEVRIVIPSSARPEMRSNWPWGVTLCEDTSKDDLARIATTTRQEAKGRAAFFLEEPEHFAERDAWWSAIAPHLADPRTAVIVRTASAHTIPGELRNSFAVKAVMGYAATDPAEVTRTVEEVPDRERAWSELGKDGAGLVLQDGEVTGFTVSERAG